jgi:hypothetical protein
MGFNVSQTKGKREGRHTGDQKQTIGASDGQSSEQGISYDSDVGHRYAPEDGIWAMVDDAAVPALVNAAGRSIGSVVFPKSQGRSRDSHGG